MRNRHDENHRRRNASRQSNLELHQLNGLGKKKSTSLLPSIFGKKYEPTGVALLQEGLEELTLTSKLTLKIADSQRNGLAYLIDWAKSSRNAAIADVTQNSAELFQIFSEKQRQFAHDYKHFLQQLEKIVVDESELIRAERKVDLLESREQKLRKEILKGPSLFRRAGDIYLLRQQLDKVITDQDEAKRVLNETRAEMEVVKMFRFRSGMQGIADSYRHLASKCHTIFTCHREIVELVPAVTDQDVNRMMYDGMHVARERVNDLRRSLDSAGMVGSCASPSQDRYRRSEPGLIQNIPFSPPPPYSASMSPSESAMGNGSYQESRLLVRDPNLPSIVNSSALAKSFISSNQQVRCRTDSQTSSAKKMNELRNSNVNSSVASRLYPRLPKMPSPTVKRRRRLV